MRIAVAVKKNRVTSIFPGVDLLIVEVFGNKRNYEAAQTGSWVYMNWGKHLLRCNVDILVCGGIELFLYGAIKGFGISVIPNVIGTAEQAVNEFLADKLEKNKSWPHCSRSMGNCKRNCSG